MHGFGMPNLAFPLHRISLDRVRPVLMLVRNKTQLCPDAKEARTHVKHLFHHFVFAQLFYNIDLVLVEVVKV